MKVCAFLITLSLAAQVPTFRSEVSLVKVDVRVMPGPNKPSGVLAQDDFAVYDEGVRQKIRYFGREDEPLNLILVLDVSDSMRRSLSEVASNAREALGALGPEDQVGVVLYATRSMLAQPLTKDRNTIREAILSNMFKQTLGRDTMMNGALMAAVDALRTTPLLSRRAILVVTDNFNDADRIASPQVERALQSENIVLNAIVVPPKTQPIGRTAVDVAPFVKATGGEMMTTATVATVFRDLLERIRARYTFQYPMPAGEAGKFRHIRVELSESGRQKYPGAQITAREGYFIPN